MDSLKVPSPQDAKLHFLDYWRIIRIRKTVILAVFLLVVITATLVTFVLPESFASTARIRVQRDQSDISSLQSSAQVVMGYDPYFIQTEFEVIQSTEILSAVIDQMKLNTVWGKKLANGETLKTEETMAYMKGRLDLHPVRNTELIEIRFFSDKPQEAADVANAIAKTYREHRQSQRKRLSTGGIDALEKRFQDQLAKVKEAQKKVDTLRDQLKISDPGTGSEASTGPLMTADTLRKIESERITAQVTYVGEKTLLDKLLEKQKDPLALAQAIPSTGATDTQLNSLLEQRTLAKQKLVILEKDYGPENVEVKKVSAQLEDLDDQIRKRVEGFLIGLQSRVASLEMRVKEIETQRDQALQDDIKKSTESRPYFEAKRDLEEQRHFSEMLQMKILSERTEVDLPKTGMVEIIDPATPVMKAVRPNKPLNISLGIIIGLVVGIGLAFFIEYLDTSVKTIDDVERTLQAPVLGVIPQNVGLIIEEGAESPHAEAYRVLRTNLLFSRKDDKLNTLAVISAGAGEGKSTTVFNLAAIFAQSGQRVLIVDSDLRRPTLHKMMRVTNNLGLTNYLLKQNTLEEVIQTTSLPSLDFMASGKLPSSSLGILSSAQMKDLISELKQHYDFVIFDSPPVMGVSDASILASEVDMTIQVIQYRRYPQPMNIRAKQSIEKVGGNLVGIVLNNINMSQDESYYYYSGYYHDYYSRSEDQEPEKAKAEGGKGEKDDKGKSESN
jgi:capsular exopolysaccharide synthesis family protein